MSQPKVTGEKKKPILIIISYDRESQQIQCDGPFNDGQLFLGMLEMAKVIFMEGRTEGLLRAMEEKKANIIIPEFRPH